GGADEPSEGGGGDGASAGRGRGPFVQPDHDVQRTEPREAELRAGRGDAGGTGRVPRAGGEERRSRPELLSAGDGQPRDRLRDAAGGEPANRAGFDAGVRTLGTVTRQDFVRA